MDGFLNIPKLTPSERLQKMASPKVDIFVGSELKHYSVPEDILCHYSPYFERCFYGNFKEAKERKLVLPEDDIYLFEAFLEYILTGYNPVASQRPANNDDEFDLYFRFMEYLDKYSVPAAGMDLYDDMIKTLDCYLIKLRDVKIGTVFSIFPKGNEMRKLFARAVLNDIFEKRRAIYDKLEQGVEGFALEMLPQL